MTFYKIYHTFEPLLTYNIFSNYFAVSGNISASPFIHSIMKSFDHKNRKESYGVSHSDRDRSENSFNREDSRRSFHKEDALTAFSRDKRPRIQRSSSSEGQDEATSGFRKENNRRRSFNPNFTKDNRRADQTHTPHRYDKTRPSNGYGNTDQNDRNEDTEGQRYTGSKKPYSRTNGHKKSYRNSDTERRTGGSGYKGQSNRKSGSYTQTRREAYPRFEAPKPQGAIRLNRFIANSGICSRREADDLIIAGVISVNGKIVSELGTKVNPEDEVRFNGEVIKGEKKVYILMNKPKGYVTSVDDPHSDKTVMDLLKGACDERVYPVGRLDKNSVGVLLFTNDGELTRKLTHPSYNKRKIYQVTLDKPLSEADMTRIAEGITLEDGPIFADEISYVSDTRREVGIEIHSGRNRIVRRIFESLGYSVQKLDRVYFAGLTKKRLKRGAWRFLTPKEVSILKSGEYE